jgi:glyoxylate carboligase
MHGTVAAVGALQKADLIVALGARFDDRVTGKLASFAPGAAIVHADIDPAEISKNRHADVPIVGDCREVIADLAAAVASEQAAGRKGDYDAWWAQLDTMRATYPLGYEQPADGSLAPQYVIERIGQLVGPEAVFVAGVGQHQMWAAQFISYTRPGTWLNSGGLGTMGFAVPAADPDQGCRDQQREPRHGQAVADAVLQPALLEHRSGQLGSGWDARRSAAAGDKNPRLREARRGVRLRRPALRARRGRGRRDRDRGQDR